ncbi:MAG: hypothetical protein ACK5MU_04715 [Candidatus Saccharimonadales bacterium]
MKIAGDKAAGINAFAISFAVFFGAMAIFAAIAGSTKGDWSFSIPLIGATFANVGLAGTLITGLLAVIFAVIGLVTIGKITDKESLVKSWNAVSKVFFVLTCIYVMSMLGLALYSLFAIGKKNFDHGDLWLSSFLPNFITALVAGVMAYIGKAIAGGKTAMLRVLSAVATGIASVGLIIVIVQTLVSFYGNTSSSSSSSSGYDYYQDILDYFY